MKTLVLASLILVSPALHAQAPQVPATYERAISMTFKDIHNKILEMAKDFPEDKYSWAPHPDSRNMEQEFRHVTIGLEWGTAQLQGKPYDYDAEEKAAMRKPHTRASVVSEMEAAIAAAYPLVDASPKPMLIGLIDHQAEHYGKLVSNYRMQGMVPPISRKK